MQTTAFLALIAPSSFAAAAEAGPRFKAAVIGHTGRGDYGHGLDQLFVNRPGIDLVAMADADPEGLAKAVKRLRPARSYADYREMLGRERPQLVSVAPRQADQHHAMVLAALEAGAHIYCEKPFTATLAEADHLLAEANRRRLKMVVSHQMRLSPGIVQLHQAVHEGQFGELLELRGYGKQDSRAGGEDMIVLGTHVFDLMRLFAGDPLSCTARVSWQGRDITRTDARQVKDNVGPVAGDEVNAQFTFAQGVHGTFTSRAKQRESTGAWGLELIGSKGSARINANIPPAVFLSKPTPWTKTGRAQQWVPFAPGAEATAGGETALAAANARLVEDWLAAIHEDRPPVCSARNGAWAVEMVMGVYQAALGATRVAFPLASREHPLG